MGESSRARTTTNDDAPSSFAPNVVAIVLGALALLGSVASCGTIIGLDSVERVGCVGDCPSGDAGPSPDSGPARDSGAVDAGATDGKGMDSGFHPDGPPPGCKSDKDCKSVGAPRCNLADGQCVPCLPVMDNCPKGSTCAAFGGSYACTTGCAMPSDCPVPDGGVASEVSCCTKECVDTGSNTGNCGGCGNVCSTSNMATITCTLGSCSGACDMGYADCNNNKLVDGCESDLYTDPSHCGGCPNACSSNNMATVTCTSGACSGTCAAGFADCNANLLLDGCEIDLDDDKTHCGACGTPCSGQNMSTSSCTGGACVGSCDPGYADCDGDLQKDGCEIDLGTDPHHCGGCSTPCSYNHMATVTCAGGACGGTCRTGYADCDMDLRSDGCEVNTDNDDNHCGNCTTVCTSGYACQGGVCTMGGGP